MTRASVSGAQRVVVKVGSSSLTTAAGGIDPDRVRLLVDSLAGVRRRGADLVLVSSGAIAAGLSPLAFKRRPRDLARQQAAASVGQVLLTVDDVTRRSHYRNAQRTFAKLLELGVVPSVNENDTVATSEIRFGDNDRLAAMVSELIGADLLVLLSDVDALYTRPPHEPGARPIANVPFADDLSGVELGEAGAAGVGTGGAGTKIAAAKLAAASGTPVLLASTGNVAAALAGEVTGTWFEAAPRG